VVVERTVKTQAGNPAFLELVLHCVELRAKLLGLLQGNVNVNANMVNIGRNPAARRGSTVG
jgi:hypothetical protein